MNEKRRPDERLARYANGVLVGLGVTFTAMASPIHAQMSDLVNGDVVRIELSGLVGQFTLEEVSNDSLALRDAERPEVVRVPIALLTGLEVQRPRSRLAGAGRGALVGILIGGGGGAVIGGAGGALVEFATGDSGGLIEKRLEIASVGGVLGLGVGFMWGLISTGHHWEAVPVEDSLTLDLDDGRIALGYRYEF